MILVKYFTRQTEINCFWNWFCFMILYFHSNYLPPCQSLNVPLRSFFLHLMKNSNDWHRFSVYFISLLLFKSMSFSYLLKGFVSNACILLYVCKLSDSNEKSIRRAADRNRMKAIWIIQKIFVMILPLFNLDCFNHFLAIFRLFPPTVVMSLKLFW